jgi:NAD(P)-dependent dehydrogenase (short-subunit alcohol dehydrogenase family)
LRVSTRRQHANRFETGRRGQTGTRRAAVLAAMIRRSRARRPVRGTVVVITGASSGIGRATAREFAHRGASVVLAARREEPLHEVAESCERYGVHALVVPTDTTDEPAVEALAARAVERFGRIDVWVNNAAVYAAGRFEEVPSEVFRRIIETNLVGYANGARAAVREFRRRGSGVLINVGSIGSQLPMAYFSAYTAAKYGVLGLTLALRQELRGTDLQACVVLPASIDTPIFQHAANYSGRALRAMSPVSGADQVACSIVSLAERPRRIAPVGHGAGLLGWLNTIAPPLAERFVTKMIELQAWQEVPVSPTSGNLFAPVSRWTGVSGGWKDPRWPVSRRRPEPLGTRG